MLNHTQQAEVRQLVALSAQQGASILQAFLLQSPRLSHEAKMQCVLAFGDFRTLTNGADHEKA